MSSDQSPDDPHEFEPAGPLARPLDPEVPEADALEQARDIVPRDDPAPVDLPIEVPEADAIDQATEVLLDDDE